MPTAKKIDKMQEAVAIKINLTCDLDVHKARSAYQFALCRCRLFWRLDHIAALSHEAPKRDVMSLRVNKKRLLPFQRLLVYSKHQDILSSPLPCAHPTFLAA